MNDAALARRAGVIAVAVLALAACAPPPPVQSDKALDSRAAGAPQGEVGTAYSVVLSDFACADGRDNDRDGATDWPADDGCEVAWDTSEYDPSTIQGNPDGGASIPTVALQRDVSSPDHVVGTGTPESCTTSALAAAMRSGGIITFDCGAAPHTIVLSKTLYTCNKTNCSSGASVSTMVLDGGGLITLSGNDAQGIFYANTCEQAFGWRDSSCQNDTTPVFVFQNIAFEHGDASQGPPNRDGVGGGGGGGAIAIRGGQLILNNTQFRDNRCMTAHSDAGGGAIRVTGMEAPVYIVNTTIDNNRCASGGGISSLHATVHVLNSVITNNTATGHGASSGLGGNGGGIYFDGTSDKVIIDGSIISGNYAPEGGPGVFYVSNDRSGTLTIRNTTISGNSGQSFYTSPYRSIFYLGKGSMIISGSSVQ